LSRGEPMLSQLMVTYPFTPQSRTFFDELPIEESFSSMEVLKQAQVRLLSSIGRIRYEPHLSELIEFSSFFVAALVASQDVYLGQRFALRESESARRRFIEEPSRGKPVILKECFGVQLLPSGNATDAYGYLAPVQDYLATVTRFGLNKKQRWMLVNQALSGGVVYFTENNLNDLFGDLAETIIYDGVKNLRKVPFPRQLANLREEITPFLPPPRAKSTRGYSYIDELLKHPTTDGRHRLVWLILSPYLVNVKQVPDEEAVEEIREFVAAHGEGRGMKRFIEYNVKRARRNGLMPPTLSKLKTEHPDLYELLPKEVIRNFPAKK
jgi:Primase X